MRRRIRGVGIAIREPLPPRALAEAAALADRLGYSSLWFPEFALREAFGQMAALAMQTERIALCSGVLPIFSRTPVSAALGIATVDALSHGRAVLGLGVSHASMVEAWQGRSFLAPVRASREYVEAVRATLGGGTVCYEGQVFQVRNFRLGAGPHPHIPIFLAALGPQMLRTAGQEVPSKGV